MKLRTDGTTRLVLVLGRYALKFARGRKGRFCNLFEAKTWAEATPARRQILCPVVGCAPLGLMLIMPAARPLTQEEFDAHDLGDTLPDWDYLPGDPTEPFEDKGSDWGMLDGRLVALDYSWPAIPFPDQGDADA
jgi:hypothetical protein